MQHTAPRPAHQPTLGPEWIEALVGSIATAVTAQLRQQPPMKPQPAASTAGSPFMTINEAAVFLRCKPQRLYDLLSARTLQGYKDGGEPSSSGPGPRLDREHEPPAAPELTAQRSLTSLGFTQRHPPHHT